MAQLGVWEAWAPHVPHTHTPSTPQPHPEHVLHCSPDFKPSSERGWWLGVNHFSLKVKLTYGSFFLLFKFILEPRRAHNPPRIFHGAAGGTAAPLEGWG